MNSIVSQKAIIPLVSNRAIELMKIGDEYRIDSRIVAKGIGIEHRALLQTLRKYQNRIEELGVLTFQMSKPPVGSEGGRPETYVMLNKNQVGFAITLSRNTEQVVDFKFDLIKAFDIATRPLRPCSHRPELTPAQERELIKKYVQHIWDRKQEAPTATELRNWVQRYDRRIIVQRLEELVDMGEITSFKTNHSTRYKPIVKPLAL